MTIRLVSLNLELDNHLDEQRRFFEREAPDVACLQEVHREEFETLRADWGHGVFAPMCLTRRRNGAFTHQGVCIVSRAALTRARTRAYHDPGVPLVEFEIDVTSQYYLRRILLTATVTMRPGVPLTIATTHFNWSPGGQPTPDQRQAVGRMLGFLGEYDPLVLCGDFNAPRGGEIFAAIANRYVDRIPAGCKTSIDGSRHRAGPLDLMVDGLFTSPRVAARNVRLVDGVSDHMAVLGEISMD